MLRAALVLAALAGPALGDEARIVVAATLTQPTERYDHGVLGDAVEWGGLELVVRDGAKTSILRITLPKSRVFEDVTARVADLDGDGRAEVLVVETDLARGASLAVYGVDGKRAATPFLGQTHRWLAPAGVGDFDGDGRVEIAYVDRPHLRRELVFVRLDGAALREVGRLPGLTNHRIGDPFITGGVRNCGRGDEVVLASADWTEAMVARMAGATAAGPVAQIPDLLACRD